MGLIVRNTITAASVSLTIMQTAGPWRPLNLTKTQKTLYLALTVVVNIFSIGVYFASATAELIATWGNLAIMTNIILIMLTYLASGVKIAVVIARRERIGAIIREADQALSLVESEAEENIVKACDRMTFYQQFLNFFFMFTSVSGWAFRGDTANKVLPVAGRFPYDTTKSPAYEITYFVQIITMYMCSFCNIAIDTLIATLIAQCACRFRLIATSLSTIGVELQNTDKLSTAAEDQIMIKKLRRCIQRHQYVLNAAAEIQACFSEPTFILFTVSSGIICFTAYQLSSETSHLFHFMTTANYLLTMVYQVFIYCYQGNELTLMSEEIANAAYNSLWYRSSAKFRRSLLVIMVRARQVIIFKVGGFTQLSLDTFVSIVKASYTFFTVLKTLED